jgi:hypothetical protein
MQMRAADSVVFKQVGDELVLLDYARGMYYGLDPIGARIWELLLAEERDVDEVVDVLTGEYDAPRDRIAADVELLVSELREKGLIVVRA